MKDIPKNYQKSMSFTKNMLPHDRFQSRYFAQINVGEIKTIIKGVE